MALGEKELTYVSPINGMIKNEFNAPITVSFLRKGRKGMSVPTLVAPLKSTIALSVPALIEYLKFPGNEELNHKESPMRMLSLPGLKVDIPPVSPKLIGVQNLWQAVITATNIVTVINSAFLLEAIKCE